MLFEDNYPAQRGDCYSIKKAFMGAGFESDIEQNSSESATITSRNKHKTAQYLGINPIRLTPLYEAVQIPPNSFDAKILHRHMDSYYEFPPVFQPEYTRWNDPWDERYPTLALCSLRRQRIHTLLSGKKLSIILGSVT